ncbi:flagellar protein FlaG [Thalassospira lucentensis]|uniref:flagellar protein FlaG n=1 Tax=Thalassospira lucentensis TaxID=168935 RepID=UPI00399D6F7B
MELVHTYNPSSVSAKASKVDVPASSSSGSPSISQIDLAAAGSAKSGNSPALKLQQALANLDIPEIANNDARVELNFNQDTGRVVAKITDRASGEVLRELPSKELQQLFSQMREYLGSVVDEEI